MLPETKQQLIMDQVIYSSSVWTETCSWMEDYLIFFFIIYIYFLVVSPAPQKVGRGSVSQLLHINTTDSCCSHQRPKPAEVQLQQGFSLHYSTFTLNKTWLRDLFRILAICFILVFIPDRFEGEEESRCFESKPDVLWWIEPGRWSGRNVCIPLLIVWSL